MYKKNFVFACVCPVVNQRRRYSIEGIKSHGTRLRLVPCFCSSHTLCDIVCHLLQYTHARQNQMYLLNLTYNDDTSYDGAFMRNASSYCTAIMCPSNLTVVLDYEFRRHNENIH